MSLVCVSVLVPVLNKTHSIRTVLEEVITAPAAFFRDQQLSLEILVVASGTERSFSDEVNTFAAEHPEVSVRLISGLKDPSMGTAMRLAIAKAEGEICIVQDANPAYDPHEYSKLLTPLLKGQADVVVGSQFKQGSKLAKFASGLEISDLNSEIKAFRTSLAQTLPLRSTNAGFNAEFNIQMAKRHARFIEVPIADQRRAENKAWQSLGVVLRTRLLSAAHTEPAADMLVAMSHAKRFNGWMADTISPFVKGDVLEIGAGIGNLTVLLASHAHRYLATDTDSGHIAELRSRTAHLSNVRTAIFDFTDSSVLQGYEKSADTVVCLNVLEHVADDQSSLKNIRQCLRPGGTAIVLVPQSPELFGSFDEVLHHKRRYTQVELRQKMSAAGFSVSEIICFNRVTWPGWYFNSRILRRRTLSRMQLWFVDQFIPLWRKIDRSLPWPSTSIIGIGTATNAAE